MLPKLVHGIKLFPIASLGIGVVILLFYMISHIPDFVRTLTIRTEHPKHCMLPAYDRLLRKHVKKELVDYQNLKKDPDLEKAVKELEVMAWDKLENEKETAAYWINASNLFTLKIIADHYPLTDTTELSPSWSGTRFILGGESINQSRTVHRTVQELENDTRVIPSAAFLICQGSQSDPPLTDHAITAESLESDARFAAYSFVNNPDNVAFDEQRGAFLLSPLFKRYEEIIKRSGMGPHEWAVAQMHSDSLPNLGHPGIMKTYFGSVDHILNDTALASEKDSE